LLFAEASAARGAGEQDEDRSFAPDLNLDQIVAAIAGDREERDLITAVLFGHLHDADAVRYRQEVFQDLENPALFDQVQRFVGLMDPVRAHLRQLAKMQYRYQREGSEIGRQVVRALLDAEVKVFFVTHRFDFAEDFHRQYAGSTLFLRAERQPDGHRNYKLAVKEPLPTSFGEDLYYRLGGWLDEDEAFTPSRRGSSSGWRTGPEQPGRAGG
jgi:hypothetical protein